jgi:hypothetical protein
MENPMGTCRGNAIRPEELTASASDGFCNEISAENRLRPELCAHFIHHNPMNPGGFNVFEHSFPASLGLSIAAGLHATDRIDPECRHRLPGLGLPCRRNYTQLR